MPSDGANVKDALKYRAILADPPWKFATYSTKGMGRSAEAHYDCMTLSDIAELPVREWAAEDSVLFLWTTDPLLQQALSIVSAWGFTYKTIGFVWAKSRKDHTSVSDQDHPIGTGYWARGNPELCLLATRGKPKRLSKSVRKLIVAPRREHSRKPDEIYSRIEALCEGPYLEMFSRFPRNGWDCVGIEDGIRPRRWKSNSYPGRPA
jgi:N6-adenosine-specific RNA methylase IME4